ncbi:PQQ-dependent sugar dehydrogenase, partial [Candidatus Daviesbacteria bacterium]|nr:PQQ-dependent sugar dehydrogenase [Candidatus Daviesbacteria bacterium]
LEFSSGGTLIASITSDGKIMALKNGEVIEVLTGLNKPHGIAFFNSKLFVAEETKVTRFDWDEQNLKAVLDKVLFDLPPAGNHFTRSLVFDKSGNLYISVGSTCNVCNESDPRYAAVLVSDAKGSKPRVFAKGLRNSVFVTLNEKTGEVWATDMGRDFLGDDLPPDEINILKDGKDYGWPDCFGNKVPDTNFNPDANCDNTEPPIYEIPAHSAPLGLIFDPQGDLLVAYHGSWNRSVPTGYKIVKLKVNGNQITGAEDLLTTGGRPVDLIFDKEGNLYISDDKNGAVYIIKKP